MIAGYSGQDAAKQAQTFTFSRHFYPKQLTVHSGYTFFFVSMCSLGIEPTTFALLTQCSTTEPQEHYDTKPWYVLHVSQMGEDSYAGTQCFLFSERNSFSFKLIHSILVSSIFSPIVSGLSTWSLESCFVFGEQCLSSCSSSVHTMVSPCSPDAGFMNINISNVRKAFSCLEVTLGTFTTSQTITRSALEWSLLVDLFSGR